MIQSLIRIALEQLRADLPAGPGGVRPRLEAGPIARPEGSEGAVVALSPGPFTFNQRAKDPRADQPRPMPVKQRIAIAERAPRGPYPLDHRPLKGRLQATLVLNAGSAAERQTLLWEDRGFTIDEARGLLLDETVDVRAPGILVLESLAAGIFSVREFRQSLFVDSYAAAAEEAERWASLTASSLLTRLDLLLKRANASYGDETLSATHRFEQLDLIEGVPDANSPPAALRLVFQVAGRLRVARSLPEGVGLIEQIVSPGPDSETLVPLNAELA